MKHYIGRTLYWFCSRVYPKGLEWCVAHKYETERFQLGHSEFAVLAPDEPGNKSRLHGAVSPHLTPHASAVPNTHSGC